MSFARAAATSTTATGRCFLVNSSMARCRFRQLPIIDGSHRFISSISTGSMISMAMTNTSTIPKQQFTPFTTSSSPVLSNSTITIPSDDGDNDNHDHDHDHHHHDHDHQDEKEGDGHDEKVKVEDDEMEQEEMFVNPHESMGHEKREWGGPRRGGRLPEPTRYGDWERKGRCSDF